MNFNCNLLIKGTCFQSLKQSFRDIFSRTLCAKQRHFRPFQKYHVINYAKPMFFIEKTDKDEQEMK
jgi:hypothetical protein